MMRESEVRLVDGRRECAWRLLAVLLATLLLVLALAWLAHWLLTRPTPVPDPLTLPSPGHDSEHSRDILQRIRSHSAIRWKAIYNRFASPAPREHPQLNVPGKAYEAMREMTWEASRRMAKLEAANKAETLPSSFDARSAWPSCSLISRVPNQGGCGSCWAVAAAGVLSDRLCIASGGRLQVDISAQDILTCCPYCGNGCSGGSTATAFHYFMHHGFVSGGAYGSFEGCRPYEYTPACGHPCPLSTYLDSHNRPQCHQTCSPLYNSTYRQDKHYGWIVLDITEGSKDVDRMSTPPLAATRALSARTWTPTTARNATRPAPHSTTALIVRTSTTVG